MTDLAGRYRTQDREILLVFPDLYSRAITRRRGALCDFLARALPLFDLAEEIYAGLTINAYGLGGSYDVTHLSACTPRPPLKSRWTSRVSDGRTRGCALRSKATAVARCSQARYGRKILGSGDCPAPSILTPRRGVLIVAHQEIAGPGHTDSGPRQIHLLTQAGSCIRSRISSDCRLISILP